MTTFAARNVSEAVLPVDRETIWAILVDPDALARLTPLIDSITADGDCWTWQLTGISALGVSIEPAFTENMRFVEPSRIEFSHEPPDRRNGERAGANGVYTLEDAGDEHGDGPATRLFVDITLCADLPLPKLSRRPVERVMREMMERTGNRFAENLYRELGIDPARVTQRTLDPDEVPAPA